MTPPISRIELKWVLFAVVASLLCWRIVVVNVAQYLAADDNLAATAWNPNNPVTLLQQAVSAVGNDPARARRLALRAAWENPADGRAFLVFALIEEQAGRLNMASKAIRLADFLAPRRSETQLQIANFWARQGRLEEALPHWSVALQMRPELNVKLFPELLRFIEAPQMRPAFARILADPPAWWNSFFLYALNNAAHPETLKAIYLARANTSKGVGHVERKAYLDRLLRDGMWIDAYFIWLNGLDASQLSVLGNIYDGGFELDSFDEGYDWRFMVDKGFTVDKEHTYGTVGDRALHVAFVGPQPRSRQLAAQYLLLDPGQYRLRGRVRIDSLAAGNGVRWMMQCANSGGVLASSELFIGTDHWKSFGAEVKIPETGCAAQIIKLEMDPGSDRKPDFSGSVWFDDMILEKTL